MTDSKTSKSDYTLIVPKDRAGKEHFEIQLNELDEATFIAAQKLLGADKETEAIRFLVRSLWAGGDDPEEFGKNFLAVRAATMPLVELIKPLEGELKKN